MLISIGKLGLLTMPRLDMILTADKCQQVIYNLLKSSNPMFVG